MHLIIIGANHVGRSLARFALRDGHDIVIIEQDGHLAEYAKENLDARVLHAHIGEGTILEEAEVDKADAVIAVTEDDSANLMAMFLAKEHEVETLVGVVNEKPHTSMFERLGVHVLIDPEDIIAQHLYGLVCQPAAKDILALSGGGQVMELEIGPESPLAGETIGHAKREGHVTSDMQMVAVYRDEECIIPDDDTRIESGDHVTVFSKRTLKDKDFRGLLGSTQ